MLIRLLHFDDQGSFEAALRGLYRLFAAEPALLVQAIGGIESSAPEVRRRFMLISERLATLNSDAVRPWLEHLLDDAQLDVALSGWVALQARYRVTGESVRSWPAPAGNEFAETRIVPVAAPLLERPSTTKGLHTSAARASASFLEFLSAACKDKCDDVRASFAASERAAPSREKPQYKTRNRLSRDMVSNRDGEVEHLMEVLRDYERRGRFHDVQPSRLAQALVPAADPHVFLSTPAPLDVEVAWPVDNTLDKLLNDRIVSEFQLAELVSAGLPRTRRLLAGSVRTYSRKNDVAVFVDHFVPLADHVDEHRPTVLNGRMFLVYDFASVIVGGRRLDQEWLTHGVGGLFTLTDAIVDFFPSPVWQGAFCWTPKPGNPLVWTREDQEVAWFERHLGPFRRISVGDFVYRQPVLARWTCAVAEWERISRLMPRVPVRSVRFERGILDDS